MKAHARCPGFPFLSTRINSKLFLFPPPASERHGRPESALPEVPTEKSRRSIRAWGSSRRDLRVARSRMSAARRIRCQLHCAAPMKTISLPSGECAHRRSSIPPLQIRGQRVASTRLWPKSKRLVVPPQRPLEHDEATVRQRLRRPCVFQQQGGGFLAERRNRIHLGGPFPEVAEEQARTVPRPGYVGDGTIAGIVCQDVPTPPPSGFMIATCVCRLTRAISASIWPSGDTRGEKATTGPPRRTPAHSGVASGHESTRE